MSRSRNKRKGRCEEKLVCDDSHGNGSHEGTGSSKRRPREQVSWTRFTVEDSPYPEVRAAVPNFEKYDMPQNTLRMWVIGILMSTVGCAINVVFSFHSPVFQLSTFVSAMMAWPLGRLWENFVCDRTVFGIQLNPGPFNIKEHALITIMSNVSFGSGAAYVTNVVTTVKYFYHMELKVGFSLAALLSSQVLGFAIAGLGRRVLVYPSAMIWPTNLVTTTFLTNIHLKVNHVANGWRITRKKFFLIVAVGSLLWSWIPQFFAPCLSSFTIMCWMAPKNVVINQLFGTNTGLGMLPMTFDWSQIVGYLGSPLIPPFFALSNIFLSIVVCFWIITPAIHYCNIWFGHYLPISSSQTFDRFQKPYDVNQVLEKNDAIKLDEAAYLNYSPLYLPTTFAISYGLSFASITSALTHTTLFYGKDIAYYWLHSRKDPDDVHMKLMRRYKEVPDWWFLLIFGLFFGLAVITVRICSKDLPVWALILALSLSIIFLVPAAIIMALTNIPLGLNVLCEFLVGYLQPGRPIAMMLFKNFGYITNTQAITFLQDMKLGHYLKIAPRLLFVAQLVATVWGALVQLGTMFWTQYNIVNICTPNQKNQFTCPQAKVFFDASMIWGTIGPARQFAKDSTYRPLLWWFVVGATLPVLTWVILKYRPKSVLKYIHWPVFFMGANMIPPATPYNYATYCTVGYIFGYILKRRRFSWWAKYNYTLSAGLDLGLAFGQLLIFLLTFRPTVLAPKWWGTVDAFKILDIHGPTLIHLPNGQSFGRSKWT